MIRAVLAIATVVFVAFPALAEQPTVPQACASQLVAAHPDWKPYKPDDPNAPRYKGFSPKTVVSADLDSDGLMDVAVLAMFKQQHPVLGPEKGIAVFACLSSRKNELVTVSHIAWGDSLFSLEAVDNSRENMDGVRSRAGQPPKTGILWHHNSYGGFEYWYQDRAFIEGDFYGED